MSTTIEHINKELLLSTLVDNLPFLRAKLGITQAQLAGRMGITRQTLTAIENKNRKLTWNNFLALCFIFEANEDTKQLLQIYDICPAELKEALCFK